MNFKELSDDLWGGGVSLLGYGFLGLLFLSIAAVGNGYPERSVNFGILPGICLFIAFLGVLLCISGGVGKIIYYLKFGNLKKYEEALKINPQDVDARFNEGIALSGLKRYKKAIKAYDEVLKIDPQYTYAWFNKGVVLGKLKRYEDAIKAYDEALKINPQDVDAWFNKGAALINLGRNDEANKTSDEALKINPQNADAWNNKGIALKNLRRKDEAKKAFDEASKLKKVRGLK